MRHLTLKEAQGCSGVPKKATKGCLSPSEVRKWVARNSGRLQRAYRACGPDILRSSGVDKQKTASLKHVVACLFLEFSRTMNMADGVSA